VVAAEHGAGTSARAAGGRFGHARLTAGVAEVSQARCRAAHENQGVTE
jgi:hypothetical protein